jgi:hypothetical protein
MVSSEGACAAYYSYGRHREVAAAAPAAVSAPVIPVVLLASTVTEAHDRAEAAAS